jgi:hypothetical protein
LLLQSPKTAECENCKKKKHMTDWFGLHLYLIGDQVGYDDPSKGMHATKHFMTKLNVKQNLWPPTAFF